MFTFGIEKLFTTPLESLFDLFVAALRFFDAIYEAMIEFAEYAILGRVNKFEKPEYNRIINNMYSKSSPN